jgi:hypothetical protein
MESMPANQSAHVVVILEHIKADGTRISGISKEIRIVRLCVLDRI